MKIAEIDRNLKKYLPKGSDTVKKAMRYSVLSGGKRLRPMLVIESAKACGASPKDAMPAACAVEFVHTYSLIHDDLPAMDNDDYRRGKPACHKVFGEANAILAGDALLTLAFEMIASHASPECGLNIIKELSQAIGAEGMVLGQALDLENSDNKKINLLKTARFLQVSAKTGGMIAGAPHKEVRALEKFGLYLGLSFQIVDDHLDGEKRNRSGAKPLIEKANRELKVFGRRAGNLKRIASEMLKRTE